MLLSKDDFNTVYAGIQPEYLKYFQGRSVKIYAVVIKFRHNEIKRSGNLKLRRVVRLVGDGNILTAHRDALDIHRLYWTTT